jgi:hypothetical protein
MMNWYEISREGCFGMREGAELENTLATNIITLIQSFKLRDVRIVEHHLQSKQRLGFRLFPWAQRRYLRLVFETTNEELLS